MAGPSLEGVLSALDDEIDAARRQASPDGYFPCLYRRVTEKVAEGIAEDFFDDAGRMARLDRVFAERYLDARRALRAGRPPTRSWHAAFSAAQQWRPAIVQHLLLGINAHINLDLGIATAATAPPDELSSMRRDFDRINEILHAIVAEVMRDIGGVSPWIGLLDAVGGRTDDEVVRFSITVARTQAWRFATELAPLPADQRAAPIRAKDARVAALARRVLAPGPLIGAALLIVRLRETKDVRRVIDVLRAVPGPDLQEIDARVQGRRDDPSA